MLQQMDARELPGIGFSTAEALRSMGIQTVGDLQRADTGRLQSSFGRKRGQSLHELSLGIDRRPWDSGLPKRRSVGAQVSWGVRFNGDDEAYRFLDKLCGEVVNRLESASLKGRTVSFQLMRQVKNAPEHARKGSLGHGATWLPSQKHRLRSLHRFRMVHCRFDAWCRHLRHHQQERHLGALHVEV